MVRKYLLAGALAAAALSLGGPAKADPKFLEPYGDIYDARTLIRTEGDLTPGNANQAPVGADRMFVISPFIRTFSSHDTDVLMAGGGIAWVAGAHSQNPWEIYMDFADAHVDPDFGSTSDHFAFDLNGKFIVWGGHSKKYDYTGPVISLFGRYEDIGDFGHRWDVGIAADQKVTSNVFATANLGYAEGHPHFGHRQEDVVPGFGLTWMPSPHWSISGDYVVENDVDGEDFFSLSLSYLINKDFTVRIGGGKDSTVFANVFWRVGNKVKVKP